MRPSCGKLKIQLQREKMINSFDDSWENTFHHEHKGGWCECSDTKIPPIFLFFIRNSRENLNYLLEIPYWWGILRWKAHPFFLTILIIRMREDIITSSKKIINVFKWKSSEQLSFWWFIKVLRKFRKWNYKHLQN